ncbi:phosphoribosyltransferase family protein [Actinoplanes sp. NPDC049596]|uniref:phosphoribosyltransferase n=1 Tax=unclassified Actinoplanes TaxID=2626549 RepID=UPI00341682AE
MIFADRAAAGRVLARRLIASKGSGAVVLGVPRAGVPVAFEVAETLELPLDVIVMCGLAAPGRPGLTLGAVGEDGASVVDEDAVRAGRVSADELAEACRKAGAEVVRRARTLRDGWDRAMLSDRTAIVVDDGTVTGATAGAACRIARKLGARRVVLAVPVGSREAVAAVGGAADEIVCLARPHPFLGVGRYYGDVAPTTDVDVVRLLIRAGRRCRAVGSASRAALASGQ